jgi:hypothetical protein
MSTIRRVRRHVSLERIRARFALYIAGDAQVPRVLELALQYLIFERKSKVKKS